MFTLRNCIFGIIVFSLVVSGCIDENSPAGLAQYENPDYPSDFVGFASISTSFANIFSYSGRVYVVEDNTQLIESFSLTDPNLNDPQEPVLKDTVLLSHSFGQSIFNIDDGLLYALESGSNDVYSVDISNGTSEFIASNSSYITGMFFGYDGSLVLSYLLPENGVIKLDKLTGNELGFCELDWAVSRSAMSPDGRSLLVNNSSKSFLLEIDVETMQIRDTLFLDERTGPFIYNTSNNIIVFNQHSTSPNVALYNGSTKKLITRISTINPYKVCSLIPGTDIVIAPRRSENRVSILNTQNMIFAPSLECTQYADLAFSTADGQTIVIAIDSPGRVLVYSHQ